MNSVRLQFTTLVLEYTILRSHLPWGGFSICTLPLAAAVDIHYNLAFLFHEVPTTQKHKSRLNGLINSLITNTLNVSSSVEVVDVIPPSSS